MCFRNILNLTRRGLVIFFVTVVTAINAQVPTLRSQLAKPIASVNPLEKLLITNAGGRRVMVLDGAGKIYFQSPSKPVIPFIVGGALGKHTVMVLDNQNKKSTLFQFEVTASTSIDDGGTFKNLFSVLKKGMYIYSDAGTESSMIWNGKEMNFLVSWVLDNYNTMKGMQYFSDYGKNLIDVMHEKQKPDGMIWSFIATNEAEYYFETAYKKYGFFMRDGNAYFVRQPVENHVEYCYVASIYKCWKASGDDVWMRNLLSSASKALDYCVNDSLRWSSKYRLLKRALTIDSWDFQVDDEYTPALGTGNPMLVDYYKTKFGVFYGDNTGYVMACNDLAAMLDYAGQKEQAKKYRERANEIQQRLDALAWNGKFYTHFIEEDPSVKRKLGVDVSTQFSQSNAYSINRGISHEKSKAIINSYLDLKKHLPKGSPGEWYTIYPPYPKGFDVHDVMWQYMNGGVGGHVAGELALGAFENGYENYGADILKRLLDLGLKYGDGKRIWFAYTGSFPDPPQVHYKPVDISKFTNRNYTTELPGMPVGKQTYDSISFLIPDPSTSNSAIAVSDKEGYEKRVTINISDSAKTIYLLHTGMGPVTDNIYAGLTFKYADSSEKTVYIFKEKHLSNWWFPKLKNDFTDVAWHGPNAQSASVGTYWTAIKNPEPGKKIISIEITAAKNESIYNVFGITLADQFHYVRPKPESFGGPDNWAAATGMSALVEGLAGVTDDKTIFEFPVVAPRWISSNTDSVNVTIKYAASEGYVSYQYYHDKRKRQIRTIATGSGDKMSFHVLLPEGLKPLKAYIDNKQVPFQTTKIERSTYADLSVGLPGVHNIVIEYN